MEKRNFHAGFPVYLVVAIMIVAIVLAVMTFAGCASSTTRAETATQNGNQPTGNKQSEEPQNLAAQRGPGPFEVAVEWASDVATKTPPEGLRQVFGEWKVARVARVWAAGEEYRAVIVKKNTARETLAVLLHIALIPADEPNAGKWEVIDTEPTTSTHLWSEL
jgi:hypothetical protein